MELSEETTQQSQQNSEKMTRNWVLWVLTFINCWLGYGLKILHMEHK